jgi:hypothetical protein
MKTQTTSSGDANGNTDELVVEGSGNSGIQLLGGTSSTVALNFGDSGDNDIGKIEYNHSDNSFKFMNNATETLRLTTDGPVQTPANSSFFAYASATISNITTGSQQTPAVGNAEVWDLNSDLNTTNSTFTAPVTGKYLFTVHLEMKAIDSACSEYAGRIVTSNRTYEFVSLDARIFDADGNMPWMGSVVADMDADDTCYLAVLQSDGTAQTDITGGATRTWFQGNLLN